MTSYNIERHLDALTAMASNLTPYLYEDELFGHLGNNLPKLTVGGMVMRLYELQHLADYLTAEQQQRVYDAEVNINAARSEWALHYEQKILKEMGSRLGAVRWYLDDCMREPSSCAGGWPNEAEKRTIVAHLQREAKRLDVMTDELKVELSGVDSRLRGVHRDGDFLWDARLKDAYPKSEFWWLYGFAASD